MDSFQELNLSPEMARSIAEMGFTVPTPIQAQALPHLLKGGTDFLGMAATGTGKTVAFGIPLIEMIDPKKRVTQALVLCPTRELAVQVTEQLSLLGKFKAVEARSIYGGTGYGEQLYAIRQGTPIIVATPGRLVDHLRQGNLSLQNIRTVVLDEADEMLSMGFKDDLEILLKNLPEKDTRTWLFSATMSGQLRRVVDRYLHSPVVAEVNREEMLSDTVKQICYTVRDKNKPKGVCRLIDAADDFYGLIFCQTKALVTELTGYLMEHGYKVDCLHGDKNQHDRERTLALFRNRSVNILVASDVAARGLDVKDLTHVVNYSLPNDLEAYVHRIGRTARSGMAGLAISLVGPEQMHLINRIERITKSKIEMALLPGRNVVTAKRLSRMLNQFSGIIDSEKIGANLGPEWIAALEGKSGIELASRFISMLSPNLFEDREKNEEIGEPIDQVFRQGFRRDSRQGSRPVYRRSFGESGRPIERSDDGERPRPMNRFVKSRSRRAPSRPPGEVRTPYGRNPSASPSTAQRGRRFDRRTER